MQVKKGDKVRVITGKDKGKSGVILRALPREDKVIVEGLQMVRPGAEVVATEASAAAQPAQQPQAAAAAAKQ